MIDITKSNVNFYFICPSKYKNFYIEKIAETWNKPTIREVSSILDFSNECASYMFNKSCSDNVNFVDCMNEGKVVLIKMPEDVFFQ